MTKFTALKKVKIRSLCTFTDRCFQDGNSGNWTLRTRPRNAHKETHENC